MDKTRQEGKKINVKVGVVVSDKMHKTIVVRVDRDTMHSDIGKVTRRSTKFKAHDEKNEAKAGDLVKIIQTRPISKDKRYRLVEVLARK